MARLSGAMVETIESYLATLASDEPVPGGGSAATVVAASGAALVGMVARICGRNPKYAGNAELLRHVVNESDRLRGRLEEARDRDHPDDDHHHGDDAQDEVQAVEDADVDEHDA